MTTRITVVRSFGRYKSIEPFSLYVFRNAVLEAESTKLGYSIPAARKTGTTICGIVFKVSETMQAKRNIWEMSN